MKRLFSVLLLIPVLAFAQVQSGNVFITVRPASGGGGGGGAEWGSITGDINNQLDLQSLINGYFQDPSVNPLFNASNWRTDLGLVIGTDVQAYNATLQTLSGKSFTGTGNIVLSDSPTLTGTVIGNNFTLGNQSEIVVGNATRTIFGGAVVLTRDLSIGAGNPHGFDENSTLDRSGNVSMNAFDARTQVVGSQNYGHYIAFQHDSPIATSGTMDELTTVSSFPSISGSTVTNRYGLYVEDVVPAGGGSLINNYGVYIRGMTGATNNYGIYTVAPTQSFFGGFVRIGQDGAQASANVHGVFTNRTSNTTNIVLGSILNSGQAGMYMQATQTYGRIQAVDQGGAGFTELQLQKLGGTVTVGTGTANGAALHVSQPSTTAPAPLEVERGTTATNSISTASIIQSVSTGSLADGFGPTMLFRIGGTGAAVTSGAIGRVGFVRAGNNTTGDFVVYTFATGTGAEQMRLTSGGNLLVGTATNSSNGRLQLASHTAITGGIGFGTDSSIWRTGAGDLTTNSNLNLDTVGKTVAIKQGTNGKAGTFTLTTGAATVANTSITANSVIMTTIKTVNGTRTALLITPNPGVGFTVAGVGTDAGTYNYVVLEATP